MADNVAKIPSLTGNYVKCLNTSRRLLIAQLLMKTGEQCSAMEGLEKDSFKARLESDFTSKLEFKDGFKDKFTTDMMHLYSVPEYPKKTLKQCK